MLGKILSITGEDYDTLVGTENPMLQGTQQGGAGQMPGQPQQQDALMGEAKDVEQL